MMRTKNKSTKMVDDIMDFVRKHGGIEYAKGIMTSYKDKALEILAGLPQNDANKSLVELVEYTTTRKK